MFIRPDVWPVDLQLFELRPSRDCYHAGHLVRYDTFARAVIQTPFGIQIRALMPLIRFDIRTIIYTDNYILRNT